MRTSPSLLALLTAVLGAGTLVTWTQAEAIVSWEPTVTLQVSMTLVAAGSLLLMLLQLIGARRSDA